MWMPLLQGDHLSTDVAVVNGELWWWRHAQGTLLPGGMFDYWTIFAEPQPDIEAYCGTWLRQHMADYTGMVNLETIGARIIEVHLRFADQVTFHEDRPPTAHSMPPGGFRLAIVNGWDLASGFAVREKLALTFWSTQQLLRRRRTSRPGNVLRNHCIYFLASAGDRTTASLVIPTLPSALLGLSKAG
jgi:hypothetical protein